MEQDPLADWPDRTPMYDDEGRLLLVFSASEHAYHERQWADGVWRPSDVPADLVATAARQAFPGWALSTSDAGLATALVDAGADTIRHAHSMSHPLAGLPEPRLPEPCLPEPRLPEPRMPAPGTSPGLTVEALDATGLDGLAARVGPVLFAAYPPGHPDHTHDHPDAAVQALHRVAAGEVLGSLLAVSTVAWLNGEVVGSCLVVERAGEPPAGGPWVLDVFRDPSSPARGIGRALLIASLRLCAQASLPALSLVVSHQNTTARRLYDDLGFVEISSSRTLGIPG